MTRKIALLSNTAWYLQNFRRSLIRRLCEEGYAVTAIAPPDEYVPNLRALGADFCSLAMDSKGANPWTDLALTLALRRLFEAERPRCVLTFTVKANVFGTLAAASLGIPAICNVSGLGTAFIKRGWITAVVKRLYRLALHRAVTVFFQNPDDLELFLRDGLVDREKTRLLPGSGVDTARFAPSPGAPCARRPFRFLLLGRLLRDKGVWEFVEAARLLRGRYRDSEFVLMGFAETNNRTAISMATIGDWEAKGIAKYLPPAADVRPALARADCVVLPSYREGTPRSLLEAASMAKPIITTDAPGCRQVVDDGSTGYLVRVRDVQDLADKMERMLTLSEVERAAMGRRGREKMLLEFDERIVIEEYMQAIGKATQTSKGDGPVANPD